MAEHVIQISEKGEKITAMLLRLKLAVITRERVALGLSAEKTNLFVNLCDIKLQYCWGISDFTIIEQFDSS